MELKSIHQRPLAYLQLHLHLSFRANTLTWLISSLQIGKYKSNLCYSFVCVSH